jgi:non-ribosomal peptide synthetase component F
MAVQGQDEDAAQAASFGLCVHQILHSAGETSAASRGNGTPQGRALVFLSFNPINTSNTMIELHLSIFLCSILDSSPHLTFSWAVLEVGRPLLRISFDPLLQNLTPQIRASMP